MKTTAVTPADLARSVIAVPPLARNPDLSLNEAANRRLADHLIAGGVSTILYGGNANMANVAISEFHALLEMLTRIGRGNTWIIPSVGPDYGKLRDQAMILRDFAFPTAMMLPMAAMATPAGTVRAVRDFVQSWGQPATLYVKSEVQIGVNDIAELVDAGEVVAVKYAIPRKDIADDSYLDALVRLIGRGRIVSGMGERPALDHLKLYGLAGFTSGCVSISPRGSMAMLRAAQADDWEAARLARAKMLPLEDLREAIQLVAVLHDAVSLSGLADMGPILPCLSNTRAADHPAIRAAAGDLLDYDRGLSAVEGRAIDYADD